MSEALTPDQITSSGENGYFDLKTKKGVKNRAFDTLK